MLSLTTGVEFSSAALEAGAKCKAHLFKSASWMCLSVYH